jgi:OOP family OmpA-OmpF porin
MSSTLVEGITDVFRSQMLGSFAARSGESESSILRGFETSIGTMVAGLGSKVRQGGSARQIEDLVNSPANDERILDDPRSLVESQPASDGLGARFTSMLFGNRLDAIANTIGNVTGIRSGTAASLMSVGAPLLLASVVKREREGGMDFSRLRKFLSSEASDAGSALPRGVSGLLDSEAETVPPAAAEVVRKKSRGWLWLVLAVVAILLLILWFGSRRPAVPVSTATNGLVDFVSRTLPGNVNLRIPAGGMEDNLLMFIQDPSRSVDQTTWFDFDRLLFDTNAPTLQPASGEQLRNIATILQAYPNINVKIGGYTDNTGDPAENQALSQRRAETVRDQLIAMAIPADRLEAEGYGDQHPVADNSTEAGRQQNRRISMRVTQK